MNNAKVLKILLVEDNVLIQEATSLMLIAKLDCEISVASSGEEALQTTADNIYDLILMDIGLPGMNGIETTRELKAPASINCKTPVVAVTAHTNKHIRQQCMEVGMEAFLPKPFRYAEMQMVLEKLKILYS